MKTPIWLKQPITQVLLYILLYELFLYVLKYYELVKLNLSIGISLKYLFYLFLFFSFILSVLLFLKESKFSYTVILSFAYVISSIILFGITSKLIILILIISIVSFFSSYFIYNKKKNR